MGHEAGVSGKYGSVRRSRETVGEVVVRTKTVERNKRVVQSLESDTNMINATCGTLSALVEGGGNKEGPMLSGVRWGHMDIGIIRHFGTYFRCCRTNHIPTAIVRKLASARCSSSCFDNRARMYVGQIRAARNDQESTVGPGL